MHNFYWSEIFPSILGLKQNAMVLMFRHYLVLYFNHSGYPSLDLLLYCAVESLSCGGVIQIFGLVELMLIDTILLYIYDIYDS